MNMFEIIKAHHLEARKIQNKAEASILGVIIGEATKVNKEPGDDEVTKVLKKLKTSAEDTIKHLMTSVSDEAALYIAQASNELEIIKSYLPPSLDEHRLGHELEVLETEGMEIIMKNMKRIKEALEVKFPQMIEGSIVAKLIREWF